MITISLPEIDYVRPDTFLTQPSISSQLIDNLNASIHLRALLTDLFLVDEILKLQVGEEKSLATPT